jgi:hypothetical protein
LQSASAVQVQPAVSLFEKTPQLLETLLGRFASAPFMKYSNPQP